MARCLHPFKIRHPTLKKWIDEVYESSNYSHYPTIEEQDRFLQTHCIDRYLEIPCGHCLYCYQKKQEAWRLRLQAELKDNFSSFFVTLTYDDDNVPNDGVSKMHIQKFFKRFRKEMCIKLRYFLISEYGPHNTHRPHYHFALFFKQYLSFDEVLNALRSTWKYGFPNVQTLQDGNIAYMSTYCIKFFNKAPDGKNDNFMLCSRRPFIGSGYLTDEVVDVHRHKLIPVVVKNGFKKQMPRIYKEKIFDDDQIIRIREIQKEREVDILEQIAKDKLNYASDLAYDHALKRRADIDYQTALRKFKESKKI